jgi:hypothetical protein
VFNLALGFRNTTEASRARLEHERGRMLEWIVLSLWLAFAVYVLWFFLKAETTHAINLDSLAIAWKIHKKQTGCKARRIQSLITINNETVGFKCQCGYKFVQKRLIAQKMPSYPENKHKN